MKYVCPIALLILLVAPQDCLAQQDTNVGWGGPDYVPNRIRSDSAAKNVLLPIGLPESYYDWKASLQERTGYTFQADYFSVFLNSSSSLPGTDREAASGVFRFSGFWELLGRGSDTAGTLIYLFEHRHRYADTLPQEFSLLNLGNIGAIGIPFDDDSWHLTNFYWDQVWNAGELQVVAGFLDVTDFIDIHPLTSPWTDFSNFGFSIGAATMDLPNDAALGVIAGAQLTEEVYVAGGVLDLNPTDPFKGFETLFDEFYTCLEIGYTTAGRDLYFLNNVHMTLWHTDPRRASGISEGWGGVLSYTESLSDRFLVFARGGVSDGGGSLLEKSVSVGFGYQPQLDDALAPADQLGAGFNWGDPNDDLFGSAANNQYAIETYYRSQITREYSITPSVNLLMNPALNPDKESLWVFGLRGRFVF